jgi:hypothetical protein
MQYLSAKYCMAKKTVVCDEIIIGNWTITVKDDGLYATNKKNKAKTKFELLDLSKGQVPPDADSSSANIVNSGPLAAAKTSGNALAVQAAAFNNTLTATASQATLAATELKTATQSLTTTLANNPNIDPAAARQLTALANAAANQTNAFSQNLSTSVVGQLGGVVNGMANTALSLVAKIDSLASSLPTSVVSSLSSAVSSESTAIANQMAAIGGTFTGELTSKLGSMSSALTTGSQGLSNQMNDFVSKLETPGVDINAAAADLKSRVSGFNGAFTSEVAGPLNSVTSGVTSATQTISSQIGNFGGVLNKVSSSAGQLGSVSSSIGSPF